MSKKLLNFLKRNKKWIYISATIIVIVAALCVYYFFYMSKPNFSDRRFNFVSSSAGEHLKPGDKITYIINYKNTGNRDVDELVIELEVPEHTVFISTDYNDVLKVDDKTLEYKIGKVKKNEQGMFTMVVEVCKPLDNGTLINLDKVKFKYRIGWDVLNENIDAGLVNRVESSPELSFKAEAVDENGGVVRLGDILQYNLVVENIGDTNASDVEIKSNISEFVDIIENSITGNGEHRDSYILWKIDNIEADKSETLTFKVRVKDTLNGDELITCRNTLKYDSNIIEKTLEEKLSLYPDLTKSEIHIYDVNGGELYPGEIINVKIIIRNTGEKKEESYKLICPTPEGATYISRSGTPEGIRWSDEIRGLIWDLKDLDTGEGKEITYSMKVNDDLVNTGGVITTHFKIEYSNGTIELPSKSLNVRGNASVTIVVMGDSLIEKSNWVQIFDGLLETNYPYAEYNTIASGKSGEMASGGNTRFESTVAIHNPQIVIIAYGTNDTGVNLLSFTENLEALVVKSKNMGARVFINLIGPILQSGKESYPVYNDAIRTIAAKHGAVVIDVLTPLSQNPGEYLSDGVHYSPAGASVVAHTVYSYVSQYLGTIGQKL
ncbi:MAG: GDSL-type esterase/lipase family protein [Actinomycetota bacterium]|nr:GDSL-type esterase/lipase family protein [Actinomycetota bacterium]